ncbi:hypothetical protein K432DRAFT_73532 [Lepidopterella palustris CBS 459.81]|uniref:Transmembrane protein n=1 Tax=Lepidopterella palustris CBS 459.81 TaxID=1314670 RepID=A0A8E2EJR4_9PEZI|nr:hypothetical protein K432DRAFT_73532 [Lepidopterella palustris CBS 459.81]
MNENVEEVWLDVEELHVPFCLDPCLQSHYSCRFGGDILDLFLWAVGEVAVVSIVGHGDLVLVRIGVGVFLWGFEMPIYIYSLFRQITMGFWAPFYASRRLLRQCGVTSIRRCYENCQLS